MAAAGRAGAGQEEPDRPARRLRSRVHALGLTVADTDGHADEAASDPDGGGKDFPHASLLEGIRFTAQIGAPNIILGLFNKRELPTRVAATVSADYLGYRLVEGMVHSHGPGPFYVRVARDEALLVHHPDDLKFVLGGSPDPFASDPEPKRKGMAAFQPDALTISRAPVWQERRRLAESVLDTGKPVHRLAQAFVSVAADTARDVASVAEPIRWQPFN